MSWKQIKREGIVVKFRKLLAMVLAVAMIASLAPVLRTTAKAASTWEKVEWTYEKNNDSNVTKYIKFSGGANNSSGASVVYGGVTYGRGNLAKMNNEGTFTINVPEGGGVLLVAYGASSSVSSATFSLTKQDSTEKFESIKGTQSTHPGDDAYVFEQELTAGTWTLTRADKETSIAYMSLSPLGPSVSSVGSSDVSIEISEGETGSATATVNVSNYETGDWTFFAFPENDTVEVSFSGPTARVAEVNGTYTLTITTKSGTTGTVKILAGVAATSSAPGQYSEVETSGAKYITIPVTISQKSSTGGGGTGGSGTKKTVIYHKYNGTEAFSDEISEEGGTYTFQPLSPDTKDHSDLITITVDRKTYTLLGWTTKAEYIGNSCLLPREKSVNIYGYDNDANGGNGGYKLVNGSDFSDYGLISEYDDTAIDDNKKTSSANVFKSFTASDSSELNLYPIYVETVENSYDVGVTAKGPGDVSVKVSRAGSPTTDPRWLGSVNVIIYKDGVIQNTDPEQQKMYFNYNSDNMVDIELELQDSAGKALTNPETSPYVINAVIAEQGGSSGDMTHPQGTGLTVKSNFILPTKGYVDNVIGGTTVYVFMSTRYTAEFYLDGVLQTVSDFSSKEFSTDESLTEFDSQIGLLSSSSSYSKKYIVAPLSVDVGKYSGFERGSEKFLEKDSENSEDKYNDSGNIVHGGKYLFGYFVKTYDHDFDLPEVETATGKDKAELLNGDSWVLARASDKVKEKSNFELNKTNIAYAPDGVFRFYANTFGELTVSKKVEGDTADANQDFSFTVTFTGIPTGGALPASGTGYTIDGNTARFTLKAGGNVTIEKIPAKTEYTVAETSVAGFAATLDPADGKGSIESGKEATVKVTNTYTVPKGGLTITKNVTGANAPENDEFEFTVQATGTAAENVKGKTFDKVTFGPDGSATVTVSTKSGSGTITISGLPIGTYTVTEKNKDHYKTEQATQTVTLDQDGETIAFTNTYNQPTGKLTINKTVTGTNAPATWEFTFTVKAKTGTIPDGSYGTGVSYNSGDGTLTVTVNQGNTDGVTIENLPIGTYTVVEDTSDLTNYGTPTYSNAANTTGVTVTKDGTATVTVTNHYNQPTGSLTITKTVEGVASASGQVFTFTVTAPAGKIADDTSFGSVVFNDNQATVTITMDNTGLTKSVTIAGLPTGYYKVEENTADLSDYNTTYAPDDAPSTGVNVTEGGTAIATVTNTHKTGNLTIRKTVTGSGPAVPTNGTFTFTITAPDGLIAAGTAFNLGGAAGTVTFTDGKTAEVKITTASKEGSVTIENLPIGTYTVTEAKVDGYKADAETKSVTLDQDGEEISFTNTYQTGTLQITKTVDGIASASGQEFTFTITALSGKTVEGVEYEVTGATQDKISFSGTTATVTVKMDADLTKTVTIANLPAGTYTVEETKMAANYTVDGAKSKTVTIRGGNTEIVAITNKHDTGDLTITKNVTGGTNVKVSQTFTFTVKAPENLIKGGTSFTVIGGGSAVFNEHGEADVTVTLSNSNTGSVTIEGLPVGEYKITEKEAKGYTTTPDSVTVNVAKGTTPANVTITNTVQTTSLTIGKTVVYPADFPADKKLDANVVEYTFTVTFKDFPAGVTSFDLNVGSTSKTVTTADNTVIVPLKAGVQTELKNIPIGIGYEVTEAFQSDDLGRHFTTEWVNRTGTLNNSTTVTCTNTYHMLEKGNGALVIRKEAVGGQAGTVYQFKVTFTQGGNPYTGQIGGKTLGSDGSATFEMDDTANHSLVIQVPVGVTYKVEEVFASGERPKAISVRLEQNEAGDSASGETASGTISQEFNYDSVIFTNRYLGDLKISKTVPQFNGGEVFTFTVTLPTGTYNYTGDKSGAISSGGTVTLKAGESVTIQNLPAGSTYTVTEAGTANYKTESVGATGTIANNTTAAAAFTNNRNTGSLTVTKTLTGKLAAEDTFTFTVTLTGVGAGFTGTLGGVTFTNGVGTFTITGAGSRTITELPVGAGFTVKEQDAAGYVTTYNNDPANHDKAEGTISANPTTVTVNNDKPDTGTITIKKVVKNAPAANANKEFNFTITLYAEDPATNTTQTPVDIDGKHGVFDFIDGVAHFTLKNGDSIVGEGEVTVGEGRLFYKIEEEAYSDYTTTSENTDTKGKANGRVVTGEFTQDSQNTTVTFTNTYNYGSLTITKKVTDDSGASHASDKFTFTITKKGDSTFNQKVEITGANSQPVSLPAGEYIVTETAGKGDSVAYKVGTSGASAANAEVTITAGGTVTVTVTNTYYSGGGTGGTGGGGTPSPDIDTSEHYGYIIGVTHTEVAPEQNITRAEIATILFRLLTDEARAANWSENSGFPDVKSGVWYNHAVAVLHKMGIILGDDNGNFNPDQNITRAEVAAMVVRFYEVAEGTVLNNRFTDVETTKWYAEAVLLADYYGLMQGDGDTFKPEDLLTRAEAMTVFNRLLGRKPHKDHLHKDMITWTDNTDKNKWYYAEVQEATNSHTCGNNVVIDGKIYETWSAITKMRDWAALEY